MARFDPHTFPDRFALDARARQLRSAELASLAAQWRTWFANAFPAFGHAPVHPIAATRPRPLH